MNLNELWVGQDYAYFHEKGRGERYRPTALRVKIIRPYKEPIIGGERFRGMAEVLVIDKETGEPQTDHIGNHVTKKVRARDIAMRWEEYEHEHAYRIAAQERRERERMELREREERERKEKEEIEKRKNERIRQLLVEKHGLPPEAISYITTTGVHLSRVALEKELEIAEHQ